MNVTLFARDLRQTDTRILLQSFLSQWIPLSLSVLGKYILVHVRYNLICYSTSVVYLGLIFFLEGEG